MGRLLKAGFVFLGVTSIAFIQPFLAQSTYGQEQKDVPQTDLQELIDTLVQEKRLVSLALSTHQRLDDGTLMSRHYISGNRRADETTPISDQDLWHIGSCTKAMTALLYGDLVEQKRISWTTSIADIFKDLVNVIDPAWENITMEDVLAHRAGINDFGPTWMIKRIMDERDLKTQRLSTVSELLAAPPELPVGEFSYSNVGYILSGKAIEVLTGKSWEEAMKSGLPGEIMGADGWGFGPPQGDQPEGHRKAFFGKALKPIGQAEIGADNPPVLGPAGTVHTSHANWAKFALAFLPSDTQINESLKTKLLTPPEGGDYALGWGIYEDENHGLVYSHSGSNTLWLATVMVLPEHNAVILASTNTPPKRSSAALRKAVKTAADNLTETRLSE